MWTPFYFAVRQFCSSTVQQCSAAISLAGCHCRATGQVYSEIVIDNRCYVL